MTTTTKRRWHIAVVALGASAMCGLTACGSDADTTDTSATVVEPVNTAADDTVPADTVLAQPDTTEAESIDSVPTDTVPIDTAPVVADTVDDGGSGDASAECGGFTAAEVAAAAGAADFDSADDISVSTDVSCLFSNSTSVDGIIIRVAPTKDSTVDGIDGVPVEEALTTIELLQTAFLEDGYTVERVTVGGFPATVITGNDSMQGIPGGMAVTVIDGNAIVAEADGDALSTDAAGFGPIVKAVLELAVAARGSSRTLTDVTDNAAGTPIEVDVLPTDWRDQVLRLAAERDAVILAHNYQLPEIQDIAHHTGDSLGLSRIAADVDASTIVFCGVHFMAESAKILSYDKTVLIPDARAGCSLAETITADQLRAWKAEHPGAVVVSYVNTTAAVKAETDICCTSSNAVEVVASIPDETDVLFCPDQFLGAHVQRITGRDNMHIWMGECHVHAGINGAELKARVAEEPDAELFVHPECGCATSALYLVSSGVVPETRTKILSTGGMIDAARETTARTVLVATETGMLHQLRKVNPAVDFQPVNRAAVCKYMKMITPAKLLRSLRDGVDEIEIDREIADKARLSVERMIAIGTPSATAE